MDPIDKTVGAQFDDVTFVLETGRRKLSKLERVARTKYHIDVTAKVVVNSAMTFRMGGLRTELKPGTFGFSRIREEKTNKLASFFNWYFEAIELIMDRSDKSDRVWTEEQPKNHSTLTMGKLFESG
uniref:Uncharacterized protein n=1 Tax=Plectus sambesii TaxID=2011161 RepID=A0A914X7W8_9BILA